MQELPWQRYARIELASILSFYNSEITWDKATQFYNYLRDSLPDDFDWEVFCGRGIEVDDCHRDELKLFINLTQNAGEHIWLKTSETDTVFIWRDYFQNAIAIFKDSSCKSWLKIALKNYAKSIKTKEEGKD